MKQLFILFFIIIGQIAFAQSGIQGQITDKEAGTPMQGANIQIQGSHLGVSSGIEGNFEFKNLKAGTYHLKVSYVGYQPVTRKVTIDNNDNKFIKFQLIPIVYSGEEIVITATRNRSKISEIPGSIQVISRKEIQELPADKIDDIIQYATGINVLRSSGMYSMRPVVTLRGLSGNEQGRTLVMIDGVPINKGDTGGVNWNRIDKNTIERIEIFRGPGSSLYGNNAMGGVINIITSKPRDAAEGNATISYGTYNTQKSNAYFGSRLTKKLWISTSAFFTNSDGYNAIPDSLRGTPDYSVPRYLNEKGISGKFGYDHSKALNLEIQYDYFEDKRGEGEKIQAPDGEYRHFNTNFFKAKANGETNFFQYTLNVYYQKENYFKLDERLKKDNYKRFDVNSDRIDQGILLHLNKQLTQNNLLSFGLDIKQSSVDGGDYYQTSDDSIINSGKMSFLAFYIQDELSLFSNRIKIIAGLRFDKTRFYDGNYYSTEKPWSGVLPVLEDNTWQAISPRLSASFKTGEFSKIYVSYARGFRASILDDLCRSGWMWVGPKIANPKLGPEKIDNYEIGAALQLSNKIKISPTFFFAHGHDFLYYVATGDSLFGSKPIYQRQNVSEVKIYGAELEAEFKINTRFTAFVFYTYNDSKITSFTEKPELEGKYLTYCPKNQIKASLLWTYKCFTTGLGLLYKDKQFVDDLNRKEIAGYFSANAKITATINEHFSTFIDMQNIFNEQHMDNQLYLSPGRLITAGISVKF